MTLVGRLVSSHDYAREGEVNRLRLTLPAWVKKNAC